MITLAAKPVVDELKISIRERASRFHERSGRAPRLAVILIGEDPASIVYVRNKGRAAEELGLEHETIAFQADATPEKVREAIVRLNQDPNTDGILVQRPLPSSFNEEEALYWISPEKDVDAFHPENVGRLGLGLPTFQPCTPAGIMVLLKHYGIHLQGKLACIIGRSAIVGKPLASLLLHADATVIQCHSKTPNLAEVSSLADLVVAAIGKPELITASHVKKGAVVIDVGINRLPSGKLAGDVKFEEVANKASAITPVPGGVGPMTIMMLLENTLKAAENRVRRSHA